MADSWPEEALRARAAAIGGAVLELLARQEAWIHRRLERIELLTVTQFTRTVAAELTVPAALADALELRADPRQGEQGVKRRVIVPLGVLPKGALVDFTLTPADATRLTAAQTSVLLLTALAPYARQANAPEGFLALAQRIILSEQDAGEDLATARALLEEAQDGDVNARGWLVRTLTTLSASYALLVALDVVPGLPVRVVYGHRDYFPRAAGEASAAPLVVDTALVHASGPGPPYRVELVAPEGLEVETASLAQIDGRRRVAVVSQNTQPGEGAFVQLRAPDSNRRPAAMALVAELGWVTGGIHHLAAVAGVLSSGSLWLATYLSFQLGEGLSGSSAGALFAAPALVTSLVLGFATTRITSAAANRLRLAALAIALLGVTGALLVSVLGGSDGDPDTLTWLLLAAATLSTLITGAWPLPAALRSRSSVELAEQAQ